jgi:hypothetical protein
MICAEKAVIAWKCLGQLDAEANRETWIGILRGPRHCGPIDQLADLLVCR